MRRNRKMGNTNEMEVIFDSRSANESFARVAVAAFLTQLNPTVEEVSKKIYIRCEINAHTFYVSVRDEGKGIEDVKKAMLPMYTTKPEADRSGMGFSFMEAFMDQVEVESIPGEGTEVKMKKTIGKGRNAWTTQSL